MPALLLQALQLRFACGDTSTFFEHTNVCGQCPSDKIYDEVQKRCVCQVGFYESSPGTCSACSQGTSFAGAQYCKQAVDINMAHISNSAVDNYFKMLPCDPGKSLIQDVQTGQYVCVVDVKVDYNLFADDAVLDAAIAAVACPADYVYSPTYQTCYLGSDYAEPATEAADYELHKQAQIAYAVCRTGLSARACSSLLNLCIFFGQTSDECAKYNSLSTLSADIYQTMRTPAGTIPVVTLMGQATRQTYQNQLEAVLKIYAQITDASGNIIYNNYALSSAFSLCALLRSMQSTEQIEFNSGVNAKKFDRQSQFGFTTRTPKQNNFQGQRIYAETDQLPMYARIAGYDEQCSFPDLRDNLFVQFYVETSEGASQFVPVYVVDDAARAKSDPQTDFETYRDIGLRRLAFSRTGDEYLAELRLKIGLDLKMNNAYGPHLLASYKKLQRTQVKPYVQDLSPLSGKLAISSNLNKYHFKVDLLLTSGSNATLKIVIIAATMVVCVVVAIVYQCKAGGAYPCAANCVRRMRFNKKKEETEARSAWHIVMFFLYFAGYVGMGFYYSAVFYQIIVVMSRRQLLKFQSYVPSRTDLVVSFVLYTIFFACKLFEKSTPLIAVYYENGQVSWGQQFVINKIQELYQQRPGNFQLAFVVALLTTVFSDGIWLSQQSANFSDHQLTWDLGLQAIVFLGIFNICYAATMVFKLGLHYFYPSPFVKFQEMCGASGCSVIIRDTRESVVKIDGGVQNNLGPGDIGSLIQCGQELRKRYLENDGQVQRVFYDIKDDNEQNALSQFDVLMAAKTLQPPEKLFKIEKFNDRVLEYQGNAYGLFPDLCKEDVKENGPGWAPYFYCDVRQRDGHLQYAFERPFNAQQWLLRNPMYKSVTLYSFWLYELVFFGINVMLFTDVLGNLGLGVVCGLALLAIARKAENALIQRQLKWCNLVQKNFMGFFKQDDLIL